MWTHGGSVAARRERDPVSDPALLTSWQPRRRHAGAPVGWRAARTQTTPTCPSAPTRARGGAGLPAAGGAGPVPGGGGRVCAAAVARGRARRARGRQPGRHAGGCRPSAACCPVARACESEFMPARGRPLARASPHACACTAATPRDPARAGGRARALPVCPGTCATCWA